jgi:hypothetical protein
MKYAWVENNKIRDTAVAPSEQFTPEVAAFYSTEVSDEVQNGWELVNNVWTAPAPLPTPEPPKATECSSIKFLLRFTPTERVAIRASTDPFVVDWLTIMNDPRLDVVHYNEALPALDYLVSVGILTHNRIAEILV